MNNQSPLIPQGSLLEQKNKGRARVRIAVFVVLAIHGVGLLALLMQGCKKEPESGTTTGAEAATNTAPAFVEPTNAVPVDAGTNPSTALSSNVVPPIPEPLVPSNVVPQLPTAVATDYKVQSGDTYTSIARKFHVTTRAIMDANPGVDPARLKIDQVLHIPAPVASTSGTFTSAVPSTVGTAQVYAVKSGDTLTSIAAKHGVTVRAIRAANNLTTDRIVVGQKLTIPVKAPAPSSNTTPTGTTSGTAPTGQ